MLGRQVRVEAILGVEAASAQVAHQGVNAIVCFHVATEGAVTSVGAGTTGTAVDGSSLRREARRVGAAIMSLLNGRHCQLEWIGAD